MIGKAVGMLCVLTLALIIVPVQILVSIVKKICNQSDKLDSTFILCPTVLETPTSNEVSMLVYSDPMVSENCGPCVETVCYRPCSDAAKDSSILHQHKGARTGN